MTTVAGREREERRGGALFWAGGRGAAGAARLGAGGVAAAGTLSELARRWAGWAAQALAVGILVGGGTGVLVRFAERDAKSAARPAAPQDPADLRRAAVEAEDLAWGMNHEGLAAARENSGDEAFPFDSEPVSRAEDAAASEPRREDVVTAVPPGALAAAARAPGPAPGRPRQALSLVSLGGASFSGGAGPAGAEASLRRAASLARAAGMADLRDGLASYGARAAEAPGGLRALSTSALRRTAGSAFSQLRLADRLSRLGGSAADPETGTAYAAAAFEGSPSGAPASGAGLAPSGAAAPGAGLGPGAAGGQSSAGAPIRPGGRGQDVTPYDAKTPEKLIKEAGADKRKGMLLIAAGLGLFTAALAAMLAPDPTGRLKLLAAALAAAAVLALAFGMMTVNGAKKKADEAKRRADSIKRDYGQNDQGDLLHDKALQVGR